MYVKWNAYQAIPLERKEFFTIAFIHYFAQVRMYEIKINK